MKLFVVMMFGLTLLPLKAKAWEYLIGSIDYPIAGELETKITQAYNAMGHSVKFVQLPMARRLRLLNAGMIDADLAARSNLSKTYPDIIQVGPSLLAFDLYLVCPQESECTEQRLQDTSVTVYSSRGSKAIIDDDVTIFDAQRLATHIDSSRQLMTLFNQRRVNYFVYAAINQKMANTEIQRAHQYHYLGSYHLYHHIHKSRQNIAMPLAKELTRLFSAQ